MKKVANTHAVKLNDVISLQENVGKIYINLVIDYS